MHVAITVNSKFGKVINQTKFVPAEDLFSQSLLHEIKNVFEKIADKVSIVEADGTFIQSMMRLKPDYVFNLSYGLQGKYRQSQIPGILELLGIPYFASDSNGHSLALDKYYTKILAEKIGIPMPRGVLIRKKSDTNHIPTYPTGYIIKPNEDMNSNGLHSASTRADAIKAALVILREYGNCIVEEYIEGDDVTVGILGSGEFAKSFVPLKFIKENKNSNIRIKQHKKSKLSCECPPRRLPKKVIQKLQEASLKVHNFLQLRDFSRSDFRVTPDNKIFFLEVNSSPGLGINSSYPYAAMQSGINSREELFIKLYKSMVKSNDNRIMDTPKKRHQ